MIGKEKCDNINGSEIVAIVNNKNNPIPISLFEIYKRLIVKIRHNSRLRNPPK